MFCPNSTRQCAVPPPSAALRTHAAPPACCEYLRYLRCIPGWLSASPSTPRPSTPRASSPDPSCAAPPRIILPFPYPSGPAPHVMPSLPVLSYRNNIALREFQPRLARPTPNPVLNVPRFIRSTPVGQSRRLSISCDFLSAPHGEHWRGRSANPTYYSSVTQACRLVCC